MKRVRTARVIVAGHAFIQNFRRGFYDLGTDVPPPPAWPMPSPSWPS
jgi:transposase, IS6 family